MRRYLLLGLIVAMLISPALALYEEAGAIMHPDFKKERRGTALAFSLLPHRVYDSIYQLDPEALVRSGARPVIIKITSEKRILVLE